MLKNRTASFIILALIYALSIFCGFFFYQKIPFDYRLSLLITDILTTIVVFIFSVAFENASVYDPYWSVQPIVIVIGYGVARGLNLYGILLLIAISYWGIRLTANWAYTFQNLTCQDWRYTMLKEKTKKFYPIINFIGIHLVPTLVVYLCVLPAVVVIYEQVPFSLVSSLFLILSIIAATIQLIADIQIQKFRKNKTTTFIQVGIWKHSRHPNYFGEILMWWGIAISCVFATHYWYLLSGAIANTLLFCCVSIPMAEKRQSKKPGFQEYKKATRILI